ncbi:MAG: MFS transporter, partial [Anaerolineales bacterium]|nr:MFS transporter [Anaerolineales bacterium]
FLRLGWQWPEALRAMRHPNFRLFFFGQLISLSGTWMQSTAQQWLVYRLTNSQLSLGMVTFASYIPVLLLSLFMGVVVDRFQRRRLLVITQTWFMLLAAALAVLTYLELVQYWHILLLAILLGIANALDMPARQAFYIDLVEREDLMNAIALNSSIFNGARIIGPAIGGLVIAAFGEAPAFATNAVTYLATIACLLMMRLPPFDPPASDKSSLSELKGGLDYLIANRHALSLVSMTALLSIFCFPYMVLLPVFARDILKIGPEGYGVLTAAQGSGALIGALTLAAFGDNQSKSRLLLFSRGLLAVALAGLALSATPILSILALVLAGYALITQLAVTNTSLQLIVPDELRGRVMSTFTWALGGFWPLG